MMNRLLLVLLVFISGVTFANPGSTERVIWDKKPLSVALAVGHERIIHFPADVRYWLPDSIKRSLTAMAANGVLYLKAEKTFAKTRIRIQELDSPQVYLLDVSGIEQGDFAEEIIVMNRDSIVNKSEDEETEPVEDDWYARLIRVAAQNMYAPERLIEPDTGIRRIKLKQREPVNLVRGGYVEALPMAAWQGGGYTVTAVRLRNTSDQTRVIDPRTDLRGDWLVATLQHAFMDIADSERDRTCIYLVSARRFEESL